MTLLSGAFGIVGGRTTVSNWSVDVPMAVDARSFSNTRGGMLRRRGPRSWNGTFAAGGVFPSAFPGDFFAFLGFIGPAQAYTPGATGPTLKGTAIVDQVVITINWETGAIISYAVTFSGHGELERAQEAHSDLTFPDAPSSSEARLVIVGQDGSDAGSSASSGEEVEVCDITTLTLTITAANVSAVNSCSGAWTLRSPGNVDWSMSATIQNADLDTLPFDQGQFKHFRLYVDATRYWDLKFGLVKDFTGITVDRESTGIVSVTVPIEMSSHTEDSADGIGRIRVPGHPDEDWWPKGETGLEQLLNPSFADGASYWDELENGGGGATIAIAGGAATWTGGASAAWLYQRVWLEAGKTYKVSITASAATLVETTIGADIAATQVPVNSLNAPGTDTDDFAPAATGWHYFNIRSQAVATITSVSIKPYN